MKLWVNLTIAAVVATSAAAWADVHFEAFNFNPLVKLHKQPRRSYATELLKTDAANPTDLAAAISTRQKQQRIRVATIISSDADQPISVREPIVLSNRDLVKPEPKPAPWNRVVVDALVAETGWHGATRIRGCDRAVEAKFSDNLPTVIECQARGSDTVYYATTVRRDEDYHGYVNQWHER